MRAVEILRDRVTITLVAGALLAIGVLALFWSVQLDGYDRWGFRIGCGTGVASSYDQATLTDQQPPPPPQPQSGYVQGCQSAMLWRRAWAASLIVLGGGTVITLLLYRERRSADAGPRNE
jgi:hypothetical protein